MIKRAQRRFLDILASIYIYNEYRGYSSIDRVLEAVCARCPDEETFITAVKKHRRDERMHYLMFRRYFEARGYMPYAVDESCGHIDRLIGLTFGCSIDALDTQAIIADEGLFFKLCRIIMITEIRGMNQLEVLLENRLVCSDRPLKKIFEVIRRDEPSHWQPYQYWLQEHHGGEPKILERTADAWTHASLVLLKVPMLFLDWRLPRRRRWHDEQDIAVAPHTAYSDPL